MRRFLGCPIVALLVAGAAPALAQTAPAPSAAASPESAVLNQALARLGKNPRDVDALIDAGYAALAMGDVDAAVGFFARADQILPNSPRVRAGLAGALVHSGNPFDAIPLFSEAEAAGGMDPKLNAERGLAYDLVGDNATAQKYYRLALASGPNDEATRRLGLSLAIAGDGIGMERTLAPLLQRGDKAAMRIRAFGFAILNRADDAVAIAYTAMPKDLAAGISPYLRYMPRLTKAQQAAAANFGTFPRAADIGRDDPRVARFAPPPRVQTADAGLVPKGEPLGPKGKGKDQKGKDGDRGDKNRGTASAALAANTPPRSAPPELQPRREETNTPGTIVAPPPPRETKPAVAAATKPPLASPPGPPVATPPAPGIKPPATAAVASSTFDLASVGKAGATTQPAATLTPAAPASPPPAPVISRPPAPVPVAKAPGFADAFGDLGAPAGVKGPASGAVDIRKLAAAKAAAKAEPSKPAHPSRIWVQVGTGRDKDSLGFTWRSLAKDDPELFRGKTPSISDWGRTNRLLTGPFETEAAAGAFLSKLKKAKVDAFMWTSPAGQVVDPLAAR